MTINGVAHRVRNHHAAAEQSAYNRVMTIASTTDHEVVRAKLTLFRGGTGGIDSWLTGDDQGTVFRRLASLAHEPLSCGQLNQLLALSHQAELSPAYFTYY